MGKRGLCIWGTRFESTADGSERRIPNSNWKIKAASRKIIFLGVEAGFFSRADSWKARFNSTIRKDGTMAEQDFKHKTAGPFIFLYGQRETDYPGISVTGRAIMDELGPFIKSNDIKAAGLTPVNISREIYHKWIGMDSPDNVTELQVRIK